MILSAVEEVIQDRRLGDKEEFPSPTEYFAALMTALSEGGNDLSNMDDVRLRFIDTVTTSIESLSEREYLRDTARVLVLIFVCFAYFCRC
jgi:hypothetical protein